MRTLWGLLALGIASGTTGAYAQTEPDEAEAEVAAEAQPTADETTAARLDDAARQLFLAGRTAFDEGRYADALTQFRRAHEISGREQLLYNIGQSLDRLRRDAEAITAFEAYLETEPPERERVAIEARLEILRQNVATDPQTAAEADPLIDEAPDPETPPPPFEDEDEAGAPIGLIVGIVAAIVVVGAAIGVGVALAGRSPDYQSGDSGQVHFALRRW